MTESPQTINVCFESTMDAVIDALEAVRLFKAILEQYVISIPNTTASKYSELYDAFRPGGIVTAAVNLHKQMEAAEDLIAQL